MSLSKENLEEFIKCEKNPIYFIENYIKIQVPLRGDISFKLHDFQKDLINSYMNIEKILVCKSRTIGVSLTECAFITWYILFHKETNVKIVCPNNLLAKTMISRINFMLSNLPEFLNFNKIIFLTLNKIELLNRSRVHVCGPSIDVFNSEKLNLVIISEPDHIQNFENIYHNCYSYGKLIISGTPAIKNKLNPSKFRELWETDNKFQKIHLPWNVYPNRTPEWFENQCKILGEKHAKTELLAQFVDADNDTNKSEISKQNFKMPSNEKIIQLIEKMEDVLKFAKEILKR